MCNVKNTPPNFFLCLPFVLCVFPFFEYLLRRFRGVGVGGGGHYDDRLLHGFSGDCRMGMGEGGHRSYFGGGGAVMALRAC